MATVYDIENDQIIEVTAAEALAGGIRAARTLGPGTPAAAEAERQAIRAFEDADDEQPYGWDDLSDREREARTSLTWGRY